MTAVLLNSFSITMNHNWGELFRKEKYTIQYTCRHYIGIDLSIYSQPRSIVFLNGGGAGRLIQKIMTSQKKNPTSWSGWRSISITRDKNNIYVSAITPLSIFPFEFFTYSQKVEGAHSMLIIAIIHFFHM